MIKTWIFPVLLMCEVLLGVRASSCDTVGCSGDDPASLLQHRREVKHERKSVKASGKRAITFQGGGFSSVATDAAVLAGVMAGIGKQRNLDKSQLTIEGTQLFSKFDIMGSVSGGSWFISSLLYSQSFNDALTHMAQNPSTAGSYFNDNYFKPFLAKASMEGGILNDLGKLFSDIHNPTVSDTFHFGGFIEEEGSWANFIAAYLESTTNGDITKSLTLSEPLAWADKKTWLACCSIVSPTESAEYDFAARYRGDIVDKAKLYYRLVNVSQKIPVHLPARFQMPFPGSTESAGFVGNTDLGSAASVQWTKEPLLFDKVRRVAPNFENFGSLVSSIKDLPVYHVVGASSAAAGGNIVTDVLGDAAADIGEELGPRLAIWAAPRTTDQPLKAVQNLLRVDENDDAIPDTATLDSLAQLGAFALVDGVYTDNSAIGQAIATGATEITAFTAWNTLELLFGDTDYTTYTTGTVPFNGFPIFQNPKQSVLDAVNSFPHGTPGKYFNLSFGVLNLTTRENKLFGIQADISVKLSLILGGTSAFLDVGVLENFNDYGEAVQGIMTDVISWVTGGGSDAGTFTSFFF